MKIILSLSYSKTYRRYVGGIWYFVHYRAIARGVDYKMWQKEKPYPAYLGKILKTEDYSINSKS